MASKALRTGLMKSKQASRIEEPVVLPTADYLEILIDALEEHYSTMVWFHAVATTRPNEGFAFKF